ERICLKALSKKAVDRYTTAKDMAEDLQAFLGPTKPAPNPKTPPLPTPPPEPPRVVPKGLRSFDANDKDFFPELLPGPRDRDDLPESLRFWLQRIRETDADQTFAVGIMYGPSGCGKSSFVKAGLLPRLPKNVTAVYVEASAEGTEQRLLNRLRKA